MAIYNFVHKGAAGATAGLGMFDSDDFLGNADGSDIGLVGCWDVTQKKYLDGSNAGFSFVETTFGDDTAGDTAADIPLSWVRPDRFQIVQNTTNGRPYATPILFGKDVYEIDYILGNAAVAKVQEVHVNVASASNALGAAIVNRIKVVVNSCRVDYNEFVDSTNKAMAATSWKPGAIFNYEFTGVTTADTLGALVVSTMNADARCPVTVAYNASSTDDDLTFTAKQMGMDFDVIVNPDGLVSEDHFNAATTTVPMEWGSGDPNWVKSEEKKSLAHWGYHNRIWLNNQPETFAGSLSPTAYDCIRLKMYNRYNGGGAFDTSFKNGDPGDIIVNIWLDEACTAQTDDLGDTFGLTLNTASTQTFNGING